MMPLPLPAPLQRRHNITPVGAPIELPENTDEHTSENFHHIRAHASEEKQYGTYVVYRNISPDPSGN